LSDCVDTQPLNLITCFNVSAYKSTSSKLDYVINIIKVNWCNWVKVEQKIIDQNCLLNKKSFIYLFFVKRSWSKKRETNAADLQSDIIKDVQKCVT